MALQFSLNSCQWLLPNSIFCFVIIGKPPTAATRIYVWQRKGNGQWYKTNDFKMIALNSTQRSFI